MVETAGETRVPEAPGEARVLADAAQDRAIGWAPGAGNLVVLGAPGTGKTRVAVELAVRRALAVPRASWSEPTGGVMLLVPDRRRADRLGDTLEIRLAGTGAAVEVRTPVALAFQLVARSLTARGEPDPTLMSGPDVDAALADLLEGHRAGAGARPDWPAAIPPETLELPAFRAELRDLLTRAAELGVGPEDLAEFARDVRRPEWAAAAAVLGEYRDVMELADRSSGRGRRLDHARILAESATLLHYWEQDVGADVPRPAWSLVVVDDYQDATPAVAHLLRVLVSGGTQVVLVGDPDTAVQQFRGGRAHLLGEALGTAAPHGFGAEAIRLGTCYRGTPELRDATRAVTALVRPTLAGVAHRAAGLVGAGDAGVDGSARGVGGEGVDGAGFDGADERPGADDGGSDDQIDRAGVELRVLGSTALEGAYVARRLREEHLLGGTPWSGMAVIARASSEVARLRGALRAAGVPTLSDGAGGPLRDEPGVRPLLTALDAALAEHPTADQVRDLLLSPIGALDAVHLRSLVRELRVRASAEVDVDDALVACVEAGGAGLRRGSRHARGVGRVVAVLAATREALAAPRAEANGVLWECWDATGLAEVWRARALGGGPGAERADADLDAVLALFKEAERYGERSRGGGTAGFLAWLRAQDLPQDNLAARARRDEAVAVLTVPGAAGRQWDVVAIPGVQEDRWPDLRVRDTLLGTGDLADLVTGRSPRAERDERDKRREVLDDELRLFAAALGRAGRLALVTSVLDEDARPSVFVEALAGDRTLENLQVDVPAPLDLRGLVAELRRAAEAGAEAAAAGAGTAASGAEVAESAGGAHGQGAERHAARTVARNTARTVARGREAAALLGRLAAAGVTEALPDVWVGFEPPTSGAPLVPEDRRVPVSPSSVERATTCGLRWVLEAGGGSRPSSTSQRLGNLVHEIAEQHPFGTLPELAAALDAAWPGLGIDTDVWHGRRERERADAMITRLASYYDSMPRPGDVGTDAGDAAARALLRTEESLRADVGERAELRGRADRLEHTDEGWRVVDLKTGTTVPSAAETAVHPQLAAYQVALRAAGEEVDGARLVYLSSGASKPTVRDQPGLTDGDDSDGAPTGQPGAGVPGDGPAPGSMAWAVGLVDQAASVMGGAAFVARQNPTCRTCPVRGACPVQGAAPEGGAP